LQVELVAGQAITFTERADGQKNCDSWTQTDSINRWVFHAEAIGSQVPSLARADQQMLT
jgi:hypothetical protein